VIRAVLLAGDCRGGGGRPNALSSWGQTTVIGHLLDTLSMTRAAGTVIVAGEDAWSIRKRVEGRGVEVVANARWRLGCLSYVKCGLRALPEGTSGALLMSLDQAAVPATVIDQLLDAYEEKGGEVVIPTFGGQRGWPVVFWVADFGRTLLAACDGETVEQVIGQSGAPVVEVPVETRAVIMRLEGR